MQQKRTEQDHNSMDTPLNQPGQIEPQSIELLKDALNDTSDSLKSTQGTAFNDYWDMYN
jgi:hypothetical protein